MIAYIYTRENDSLKNSILFVDKDEHLNWVDGGYHRVRCYPDELASIYKRILIHYEDILTNR